MAFDRSDVLSQALALESQRFLPHNQRTHQACLTLCAAWLARNWGQWRFIASLEAVGRLDPADRLDAAVPGSDMDALPRPLIPPRDN